MNPTRHTLPSTANALTLVSAVRPVEQQRRRRAGECARSFVGG